MSVTWITANSAVERSRFISSVSSGEIDPKDSTAWSRDAKALRRLKIKHLRTRPYTPKTNGKAERFVQTSLREWAYATAYETSEDRAAQLPGWLHRYNWHRPMPVSEQSPRSADSA
jgi:hypothetical protein